MKKAATKAVAARRVKGPQREKVKAMLDTKPQINRATEAPPVPAFRSREGGILSDADDTVYGRGEMEYGHPAENFEDIAAMWTVFLGDKLTEPILATDVAQMHILVKSCRLKRSPWHRDSLVDQAGYAETHARINSNRSLGILNEAGAGAQCAQEPAKGTTDRAR